jgi:hypothetical protein
MPSCIGLPRRNFVVVPLDAAITICNMCLNAEVLLCAEPGDSGSQNLRPFA